MVETFSENQGGVEPPHSKGPLWEGRDWLALLAYLALAHLVFWPALQPGVFLYGRDTTAHDYGLLLYNWSQVMDHGRLGLWNPYLFCGLPSLGTYAFCPFYPLTWLFAALPCAIAFTYQYILNDWLAGIFSYWAARWMGLRRAGAFFVGLVFMVSGHVVTLAHAGHLQKLAAIAWIPLAFGSATAAMKARRWRLWLVCGMALAAQLLASHVQIAYYTTLFLVPWVLWTALASKTESAQADGPRHRRAADLLFGLGGLALALVVAGGLSAAQILPGMETTPISNRGVGIPFEAAVETSYPPLEFIEYILPSFLGDSTGAGLPYWGEWGSERIVSDYMGLLPLILMIFALAAGRMAGGRDRWFWLAVLLITGVLAAGKYTPVFGAAFQWLPGLDRFRSPGTIMVFIAWPAGILAGRGFDEFADRVARDAARRRRYLVTLAVAALALAALAVVLVAPGRQWPVLGSLGLSTLRKADPHTTTIYAALQRSAIVAALACAALALLAATGWLHARGERIAYASACGIVFVLAFIDPRLQESRYIQAADVRPFEIYLFHHWSDAILRALPQPVRGIEIGNEYSNRMMTRGIGSLHGYHPIHLQGYVDLMNLYAQNPAQLGRLVFEQFVLAPDGRSPGPEYERRAAEGGRVLWLQRPSLQYAYFPEAVEVLSDTSETLEAMARPDFDPYRVSYTLDAALKYRAGTAAAEAQPPRQPEGSTPTARVVRYSPDRVDLEVASNEERPMIVAELAAPGWLWLLDSVNEVAPARANHAFLAVRVPAGDHWVSLVYQPCSFRLGLYLTLASICAFVAIGLTARRIRS
jgi:hypothetical protein